VNDNELRAHLDEVVGGLAPPRPALTGLRREAGRRRRQRRSLGAVLAVLVLLLAGVGIGAAAQHGGRSVQTASQQAGDVTVPCRAGAVAVLVGQTLLVGPCADDGMYTVGLDDLDPSVLVPVGGQVFRGAAAGTSSVQIVTSGCHPPVGTSCAASARLYGTLNVTVVSGEQPVAVPCTGGTAELGVGQVLLVDSCSGRVTPLLHGGPPAELEHPVLVRAGAQRFEAATAGSTVLDLGGPCVPAANGACVSDASRDRITVVVLPVGSVVTASCGSGSVQLTVGQTLVVTGCRAGTSGLSSDSSVLRPTGSASYLAARPGRASVSFLVGPYCADGAASCPAGPAPQPAGVLGVRAAPPRMAPSATPTAQSSQPVAAVLVAPCVEGEARLVVGQVLPLSGCPTGATVSTTPGVLVVEGLRALARAPGVDRLEVALAVCQALPASARPGCAGGVGLVVITVTVASSASP
jgi:hypothetical protein